MELHIKTSGNNSTENCPEVLPDEYPCLPIFLSILENEYNQEKARTERIDTKSMALLTIIIALITVYVPIFPFDKFVEIYSTAKTSWLVPFIFSAFLAAGAVAIILAICIAKKLTGIYKPAEFQSINIAVLNSNEKLDRNSAAPFQVELIDHYQSIILANSKINTHKAQILTNQFKTAIIIFVLLSISAIGMLICVGVL